MVDKSEKKQDTQPRFIRNKELKIEKIIQTFKELIDELGYDKISTNLIAKKTSISIGTIYRYFPEGKPDILKSIFEEHTKVFVGSELIPKIFADLDLDSIRDFIKRYLNYHEEYYSIHKAYDRAYQSNRDVFKSLQDNIKHYIQMMIEKLKDFIPIFAKLHKDIITNGILVALNQLEYLVHEYLFYEKLFRNDSDFIEYCANLFKFTIKSLLYTKSG